MPSPPDRVESSLASGELSRRNSLLDGINRVVREALTCDSEAEVAQVCLDVAEQLTQSRFGLIGEINAKGRFDTIALSDPGWMACRIAQTEAVVALRDMEVRGVLGRAILEGKPTIVNDLNGDPDRLGQPDGHPPIASFLAVPLKQAEKTVGQIALANREGGYEPRHVTDVEALGVAFVEALYRKRAETGLRHAQADLEARVARRTAQLAEANRRLQAEIAERERAQQALKRTVDELKRSNEDLRQFAYAASHDLQEPLRAVGGFVRLLQQRYQGRLDDTADEYIAFAVGGVSRMQRLIDGMLSFSAVGSHAAPFRPVDANEVVDEAVANLDAAIGEHHAEVTRDDLPTVTADRTQLMQLFQNLIGNAIKFHGRQPPRVHVACRRTERDWVFEIRDNGIGIPAKYAEQVFGLFRRLHDSESYPGTGVGLAVCKRIVERHGGRIWFDSEPGKGARFCFSIPVAPPASETTG